MSKIFGVASLVILSVIGCGAIAQSSKVIRFSVPASWSQLPASELLSRGKSIYQKAKANGSSPVRLVLFNMSTGAEIVSFDEKDLR